MADNLKLDTFTQIDFDRLSDTLKRKVLEIEQQRQLAEAARQQAEAALERERVERERHNREMEEAARRTAERLDSIGKGIESKDSRWRKLLHDVFAYGAGLFK